MKVIWKIPKNYWHYKGRVFQLSNQLHNHKIKINFAIVLTTLKSQFYKLQKQS